MTPETLLVNSLCGRFLVRSETIVPFLTPTMVEPNQRIKDARLCVTAPYETYIELTLENGDTLDIEFETKLVFGR